MTNLIKRFLREEEGMGTVEIVIIIGVLVAIALIFRREILGFVNRILGGVTGTNIETPTETVNNN